MTVAKLTIPKVFFDDHGIGRDLPTPAVISKTARHYIIDAADPNLPELIDDAEYYADPYGPDAAPLGLKTAAIALLAAIKRQRQENQR